MTETPSTSVPPKRILVVDDEPEISDVILRTLDRAGFKSSAVNNPLHAAKSALEFRPDLVILDFDMPKLTGPEVALRLKQIPELTKVPILFLSGMADGDHRTVAAFSGSVAYLAKPLDPAELIQTIRGLL